MVLICRVGDEGLDRVAWMNELGDNGVFVSCDDVCSSINKGAIDERRGFWSFVDPTAENRDR